MRRRTRSAFLGAGAAVVAITVGATAEVNVVGNTGPSTQTTPYLVPVAPGVRTISIFSVGDTVNPKLDGTTPYRMIGIPDGMGAVPGAEGQFLMTVNHETGSSSGIVRAHGSIGATVSVWTIDSTTLEVISGSDLIRTVLLWDAATQKYVQQTTAFARFCSADVPAVTAFFDPATGLGTPERFHMNGEENGNTGRAFAHLITGPNAGVSHELPWMGKQSWENVVACPKAQAKTIMVGTDDTTPGQVLVYVGTKLDVGNEVQKAGMTNGKLYGVIANATRTEVRATGIGLAKNAPGAFTMVELPNQAAAGANTETDSDNAGITEWLRPEDGAWDPLHPEDFYFVTTDAFSTLKSGTGSTDARSRLWRLHFNDIANPEQGGIVTMLLDGTEPGQMYDQICFDNLGNAILQEDVGGQAHNGKIWQYATATGELKLIAKHDVARFGDLVGGVTTPATAPFNNDEESSGMFDASEFLGPGWFLFCDQAHYNIGDTELDQGGQLLALYNPDSAPAPQVITAAASDIRADVGQTVTFDVDASAGVGALTYAWDFGDGTNGAGNPVNHTYGAAGDYTATVTVTHAASGKSAEREIDVVVSRPIGAVGLTVKLNFAKDDKDGLVLRAEVPVEAGFSPAGKVISVDIGGVTREFTLAANGVAAPDANSLCKLAVKKKRGAVPAQRAILTVTLRNSDLAASLADEGLVDETVSDEPVFVPVTLTVDGNETDRVLDLIYTATAGKKGAAN